MFSLRSARSQQQEPELLEQDLLQQLAGLRQPASLTLLFGQHQLLQGVSPQSPLWQTSRCWLGGSSCLAALSDQDLYLEGPAVAALQIHDAAGHYGVGQASLQSDLRVNEAVQQALASAYQQAQLAESSTPSMVWLYQAPGVEEAVLQALIALLGPEVPIFGGSSADDDLSGQWWQLCNGQIGQHQVVIGVLAPSVEMSGFFAAGYRLTGQVARVTRHVEREILELDHQPAAEVYRRWLGNPPYSLFDRTTILSDSALHPLGRVVAEVEGAPVLLLSHPAYVEPDQRIGLFSQVQRGDLMHLLAGNHEELANKAGEVVAITCARLLKRGVMPRGGVLVFCAGSMLAIRPHIAEVLRQIHRQLPELPFVVTFTFGEQGTFVDGQSRHGNLMISAVIFGSSDAEP